MTTTPITPITEDDIAQFLASTPGFFERHSELLASVTINSPHGQRAVSLHERQAELLREKIKGLEHRVMDMVRNSSENGSTADRLHQWCRALMAVPYAAGMPAVVEKNTHELFDVPQVALRVWGVAQAHAGAACTQGVSDDVRAFASSLTMPYCGPNLGFEVLQWLAQPEQVQSLALLPLRRGAIDSAEQPAFGLLVLASPDAERFDATMGVDFLVRMAELASAALARML